MEQVQASQGPEVTWRHLCLLARTMADDVRRTGYKGRGMPVSCGRCDAHPQLAALVHVRVPI